MIHLKLCSKITSDMIIEHQKQLVHVLKGIVKFDQERMLNSGDFRKNLLFCLDVSYLTGFYHQSFTNRF